MPWIEPAAGIFLWGRLLDGIDAVAFARRAIGKGFVLAPRPVFGTGGGWGDYLRFNVAMSGDDRLYAFLRSAMSQVSPGGAA